MADSEVLLVMVGVLAALSVLGLIGAYAARYKRVPSNQAMIVYGRTFGPKGFRVLTRGGKFIVPILESFVFLSLEPFEVDLDLGNVSLRSASPGAGVVRVRATGTARISPDSRDLDRAASSILNKTPDQIRALAQSILQDHIRRTFGAAAFSPSYPAITEVIRTGAQADLNEFGVRLVSFSLTVRPEEDS